jgi:PIN domain nuclease of toxin-antitoxin system
VSRFGCVLDASALLALLQKEPGSDIVASKLDGAAMSAVNWSETVQKSLARSVPLSGLRSDVEALGVTIVPFGAAEGEAAASLWSETVRAGLSFGDRACLALARREAVTAVTADRSWSSLTIGVQVQLIR